MNVLECLFLIYSTAVLTLASERALIIKRLKQLEEGGLRLSGGTTKNEGNVEIFHAGRWGSICDDEWDLWDATVVCRQLGYPKALQITHNSHYGRSLKRIWMDNVYCFGTEERLMECRFDGWGVNDCKPNEAAGVICQVRARIPASPPTQPTQLPIADSPKLRIKQVIDVKNARVRINGGRNKMEGRVEISFSRNKWGLICGDGWSIFEAMVVCRQLNLGYAQGPVQQAHLLGGPLVYDDDNETLAANETSFFGGSHTNIVLSGVSCQGNEKHLMECHHDRLGRVDCPGQSENIAGVLCTEYLPDLIPDAKELETSTYLEDRQLIFLQCAMEENCLASGAYSIRNSDNYGWPYQSRRLLRFTGKITNIGTSDFFPFIPKNMWEWHMCHMHYHSMEVFAHYDITDTRGNKVAEGHKASFCLEDNQCEHGIEPKYKCANYGDQGISVGCSDIYLNTIDCQWIDITDLNPGFYMFKVVINPEQKVAEISYNNNAAICGLFYNGISIHVANCTLTRG